ncbi:MAG: tRNA (adenosine(37)-N6)-threonylcarbamoyltransferase complex dimerization subunit type 1 TsaB [Sporolactobacillus sp.]
MKILAIDSSNLVMGVAFATDQKVLGELTTNSRKKHSEQLLPAIAQLAESLDINLEELDRIAVAYGPGSYTGLRIGVTIAKTLAWTLKKELVGISSLEIVAQNGRNFNGYIAPFFDARRGQVFSGLYQSVDGDVVCRQADQLVMMTDWLTQLNALEQPVLFLSNDMTQWQETLINYQWAIAGGITQNSPRPAELARLGMKRETVQDIDHFQPVYLRMAEAEAKWLANERR